MNVAFNRRSMLFGASGAALAATGMTSWAQAQEHPPTLAGKEPKRASLRLAMKYHFDDGDMDLFFVIALGWGRAGGLDIGEVFYVASTIKDGDAASWVSAFTASGDRQQAQAEAWKSKGWHRQAAQARLKAFASYRSAWQFAPVGLVFDELYAKHKTAFRTALAESGLRATFFEAPYKSKTLPGVFIQNPNPEAPVVLIVGGADTCFEELYLTVGKNVLDSGYSIALVDLPGQGNTMKDDLFWEVETEKPVGAVVDVLVKRFAAKPGRIAMLGISLGGYFATRTAGYETRFGAVIASTPFYRPGELMAGAVKVKAGGANNPPSTATLRNLEIYYWKAGAANDKEWIAKTTAMVADPARVSVPFLSIVGAGESPVFLKQARAWHEAIRSKRKEFVLLDAATGADGHVQAANRLRLAQEMCGWMDTIFRT